MSKNNTWWLIIPILLELSLKFQRILFNWILSQILGFAKHIAY